MVLPRAHCSTQLVVAGLQAVLAVTGTVDRPALLVLALTGAEDTPLLVGWELRKTGCVCDVIGRKISIN